MYMLLCLAVAYLVALLYTDCNLLISQTEDAYSTDGRTNASYVCSLTEMELMFTFLNPNVLFAFFL